MAKTRSFSLLKSFLGALRTQIITYSGIWTDSTCQLSLWEEPTQYPQGTPLLFIIPQEFRSLQPYSDGGGIQTTVISGLIKCRIIVLNSLDPVQSDNNVITSTDEALGIYELCDNLIADLQILDLCFATGSYLIEPLRLVSISKPARDKDRPEWTYVDVNFEASINQMLTGV